MQSDGKSFTVTPEIERALALVKRGVDELLVESELAQKMARAAATGKPLRCKLGLDPTAPDIHLGHTVVLNKLRQLQDLGHTVIFLIGDFTSMIGDPSGRNTLRPPLSREEIEANSETYFEQAALVLDRSRTEIRYNSEWSEPLGAAGMIKLAAKYTLARLLERDDFAKRFRDGRPISLMEFLYPLLQGMDSVAVQADVELGGSDQRFNLLVGRDLQRDRGQEPQVALTMPLLIGTDGVQKMSQSLGNYVGITEPPDDMFGKLVRVPDELIVEYRRLTLDFFRDPEEPDRVAAGLADATREAWAEKRRMAREVVDLYHGPGAGKEAEARFLQVHREGRLPEEIREVPLPREVFAAQQPGPGVRLWVPELLIRLGLAATRSEARRLISQEGIRRNGEVVRDEDIGLESPESALGDVWQVGKRRFARIARLV